MTKCWNERNLLVLAMTMAALTVTACGRSPATQQDAELASASARNAVAKAGQKNAETKVQARSVQSIGLGAALHGPDIQTMYDRVKSAAEPCDTGYSAILTGIDMVKLGVVTGPELGVATTEAQASCSAAAETISAIAPPGLAQSDPAVDAALSICEEGFRSKALGMGLMAQVFNGDRRRSTLANFQTMAPQFQDKIVQCVLLLEGLRRR